MKDRGESARERIKAALEAAIEDGTFVFSKKVPLSVTSLLRLSGVSRSTFYAYYENMGDALEELAIDFSRNVLARLREGGAYAPGAQGYLNGYRTLLQYVYDHQRLFQVLLRQKGFETLFIEAVQEYLFDEYRKQFWEFDRDILRYSAVASTNFVYGMIHEWESNDFDRTPDEMAEILKGALKLTLKIYFPNE